ncbi:MAG: hypothetical protein NZ903_02175 [Candidatus Micrarchaeota archaeon]|nr:hypothetical protein [Candidatus Micrarchaeota archaeon]
MRISSMHKQRGDNVEFYKEGRINYFGHKNSRLKDRYDIIYITSLFTYHYAEVIDCILKFKRRYPGAEIKVGGILATLLHEKVEKDAGIKPHIGLWEEAEKYPPDYSLFPDFPYSITFTTRGCIRRCRYCVVPILEPKFIVRENWVNDINPASKKIIFWDNNWLCSPNLFNDIEKLKIVGKPYDFNQGLDCRLFDVQIAKLLSETKISPVRFAFDNPSQDCYIQRAIQIAKKHGLHDIRVYVLYNSPEKYDTPEFFYYRINELNKLGVAVYPMKYRPIDSTNPNWVSPLWDREVLRGIKLVLVFFYKGIIKKGREGFLRMFGTNPGEFQENMRKINAYDRALWKKRRRKNDV